MEFYRVSLNRSDNGFGFSVLGKVGSAGIGHVVYDVVENSPAAEREVRNIAPKNLH